MSTTDLLKRLLRDDHGATAVEYGLILTLIVIAIMGALTGVANETSKMWSHVQSASATATS